jgi:hypothetical protein
MSRFPEYEDPRAGITTPTITHKIICKCACKGTGLIPPNSERKGKEVQAYCPLHKDVATQYWPQAQKDGSVRFFELTYKGLNTNKELRR